MVALKRNKKAAHAETRLCFDVYGLMAAASSVLRWLSRVHEVSCQGLRLSPYIKVTEHAVITSLFLAQTREFSQKSHGGSRNAQEDS